MVTIFSAICASVQASSTRLVGDFTILEEVLTVSPKRQYLGFMLPTTDATTCKHAKRSVILGSTLHEVQRYVMVCWHSVHVEESGQAMHSFHVTSQQFGRRPEAMWDAGMVPAHPLAADSWL